MSIVFRACEKHLLDALALDMAIQGNLAAAGSSVGGHSQPEGDILVAGTVVEGKHGAAAAYTRQGGLLAFGTNYAHNGNNVSFSQHRWRLN